MPIVHISICHGIGPAVYPARKMDSAVLINTSIACGTAVFGLTLR
jgi:hypothetical protein